MKYKNNPLNIRVGSNWFGLAGSRNGFCEFDSVAYCIRASLMILRSYSLRGIVTIGDIIRTWAPPSENNTNSYVSFVCMKVGHHSGFVVDVKRPVFMFDFLKAMCLMESSFGLSSSSFDEGYFLFLDLLNKRSFLND